MMGVNYVVPPDSVVDKIKMEARFFLFLIFIKSRLHPL